MSASKEIRSAGYNSLESFIELTGEAWSRDSLFRMSLNNPARFEIVLAGALKLHPPKKSKKKS